MKKVSLLLLLVGALSTIVFFNSQEETKVENETGAGPGYFEFIRQIKGEAPANSVNLWERQMRYSKKGGDVLDSIVEVGPFNIGGRTRAVVIDKSNPDKIFVGAISGGMWVSEESGKNWKKLNDRQITLNISHLAQNPLNPDILYYSTGEGAGNSSAAPGAGIFKSIDHGKSFSQLPATANGIFDYAWRIVCSPVDTNTLYVTTSSKGMYRSIDGGQSFERVVITSRAVYDLELFPDGSVIVSIQGQGIYTSTTGNDGSYIARNSGLPAGSSMGRTEMAYCATQPHIIYAAVSNSSNTGLLGVYKSTDQGINWASVPTNPANQGGLFPFTWYCLALHVKWDDPNSVIIGSVNLMYTKNGGSNWQAAKNSHADYHEITFHLSKPTKIYIGNDGGVHEYDWNTLGNYTDLNWGLNITQFYSGAFSPNGITVMAGAQDNGTNYSLNSSETFYKAYGADGSYTQINQQNSTQAYLSYQNGRLFRVDGFGSNNLNTFDIIQDMDDNGDNNIDDGAWFINPFDINPQDGDMIFFPTKKRIYRSKNGGIRFEPITNSINIGGSLEPFCVGVSNQLNPAVYVGGSNSLFYRIKNAGISKIGEEENLRSFVPSALYSSFIGCIRVNPIDASILYISYVNYSSVSRIFKVIKADSDVPEFIDISGNLPVGMPVNWVEVDPASPDSVIFAGTDRGLFYTSDGGKTWFQEESIPNVVVDMLRLRMSDRRLFIFTHGRGVFTARVTPYNKAIPAHNTVGITRMGENGGMQIYPNPAHHWVEIKWNNMHGSNQTAQIFDAAGRMVKKVSIKNGERLNTQNLVSGLYYIKVSGIGTSKLLVQHP